MKTQFRKCRLLVPVGLCLLVTLFFISVWFVACEKRETAQFRFVFITDAHLQPQGLAPTGFRQATAHVNSLRPDFVITGGDMIMDALGQVYSRADSLYNFEQTLLQDLGMPVYQTIGNHEVFGLYTNSGVEPTHPEFGKIMFKQRIGEGQTYRSFDHKGWHFMLLDGIGFTPDRHYYGYIDSTEIAWIKYDLSTVIATTPIIVTTHIPFYTIFYQVEKDPTASNPTAEVITNANPVLELFAGHNLKAVLAGHLHWTEEITLRNVHFINVGAVSAAWWKGPYRQTPEGFAVVDVNGNEFTWRYEDYSWHAPQKKD